MLSPGNTSTLLFKACSGSLEISTAVLSLESWCRITTREPARSVVPPAASIRSHKCSAPALG